MGNYAPSKQRPILGNNLEADFTCHDDPICFKKRLRCCYWVQIIYFVKHGLLELKTGKMKSSDKTLGLKLGLSLGEYKRQLEYRNLGLHLFLSGEVKKQKQRQKLTFSALNSQYYSHFGVHGCVFCWEWSFLAHVGVQ